MVRVMRVMRFFGILAVLLTVPAIAGTFTDRNGDRHEWAISESHALDWNGSPYVPFGIEFTPRYLSNEPTEENWSADEAEIGSLKLAGITDLIVSPGKGITSISPEAFQRVIDFLEKNDMRYGIELYDAPYAPLVGYVVEPTKYREDNIRSPGEIVKTLPDSKLALYVFCDASTGVIDTVGQSIVEDGDAHIPVRYTGSGEQVLLIYPQRVIAENSADWGLPDLWTHYDRHRDRLLSFLSQIKFGHGLRFFIDPFTRRLSALGDVGNLIPVSQGFRIEYAAWLSRKYPDPRVLSINWAIEGYDVSSFAEAARLVPLWRRDRGVAALFDPVTGKHRKVDALRSTIWQDFREFRTSSIREYMNAIADVIKRNVADVPVIFTCNDLDAMFQNSDLYGFDGLAVPESRDKGATAECAAKALSVAESSQRPVWTVARINAVREDGKIFQSKEALFSTINLLRGLGAKGFFICGIPAEEKIGAADLLVWMAEYGSVTVSDRQFAAFRPECIYYPIGFAEGSVKQFKNGSWWVPTLVPARNLDLGKQFLGYVLTKPQGVELYVWSPSGPRTITLLSSNPVTVKYPSGDESTAEPSKGRVVIKVETEPALVTGIPPEQFLPFEVVQEAMQELEQLIAQAAANVPDAGFFLQNLDRAKKMMERNDLSLAYEMVLANISQIKQRIREMSIISPVKMSRQGEVSSPGAEGAK